MLKSMTGFGAGKLETANYRLSAEVKSLNSKFAEVNIKLPRELNERETEIRNLIVTALERGKISFSLDLQRIAISTGKSINLPVFQHWYNHLAEAAATVGASTDDVFKLAIAMPDVLASANPEQEEADALWADVTTVIKKALDSCTTFRLDEGKVLAGKLAEYIDEIEQRLELVEQHDPERLKQTRQRLHDRLAELGEKVQIDQNRFEQELIYYLEKLDVSEEKVRLKAHLNYFREALKEGNGKKLGFISQEIGREINTIGSKINDASIQRVVVEMKDLLERIKEQSLNVL